MKIDKGFNKLTISAKNVPPQVLDWIPNAPLIGCAVSVGCR